MVLLAIRSNFGWTVVELDATPPALPTTAQFYRVNFELRVRLTDENGSTDYSCADVVDAQFQRTATITAL